MEVLLRTATTVIRLLTGSALVNAVVLMQAIVMRASAARLLVNNLNQTTSTQCCLLIVPQATVVLPLLIALLRIASWTTDPAMPTKRPKAFQRKISLAPGLALFHTAKEYIPARPRILLQ